MTATLTDYEWQAADDFVDGARSYTVERNVATYPEQRIRPAYRLTGPQGAVYHLIRNRNTPEALFAVNARNASTTTPWDGRWFTDVHGALELPG